jgi:CPA2 family monovalent cation:H+ antiporter-2
VLHAEGFKGFLIFLVAAGIIVPLFHRARLGAMLGFLIVGVIFGPYGLGSLTASHPWLWYITFDNPDRAAPFAELGIMFLLFLLGLELSVDRLWKLRRFVLGLGFAQMALTTVAIGLVVQFFVAPPPAGIVLGLCLALSSTAVVMQVLIEQNRTATPVGRIALAVLLFQDLMVVPILLVVGLLAGGSESHLRALALPFILALVSVPVLIGAGHYVVRPLLHSAGRTGSRELILALALLVVVSISAATEAAGLSAALGAFLAGLLLSESEYRHQIEIDIEPFKGLLLGIFFITVGTNVDLREVVNHATGIAFGVVSLVALKAAILFGAARLFRISWSASVELALLLAQAGEFAFVVIALAKAGNVLSPALASSAVAVAAISMVVTPLLALLGRHAGHRLARRDHAHVEPKGAAAELKGHVVIGGYGRVGQMVAQALEAEGIPHICVDADGDNVVRLRSGKNSSVYFGDATRIALLEKMGGASARAFVVTLNNARAAERMDLKPQSAASAAFSVALGRIAAEALASFGR